MNEPEKEVTLSSLIDGTKEEFIDHISDKDLGYVNSLKNTLQGTYEQMRLMKEDLRKKLLTGDVNAKPTEEETKILDTIQGLFTKMMKVEFLVLVLNEEVEKRAIKD